MSQITRCPSCATTFKVVADQLRISEGWVRCGQCKEVFDASAHLLPVAPAPLLPDVSLTDLRAPTAPIARKPDALGAWGGGKSPTVPPPAPQDVDKAGTPAIRSASTSVTEVAATAAMDAFPYGMDSDVPAAPVLDIPSPAVPAFLTAGARTEVSSDVLGKEVAAPFAWRAHSASRTATAVEAEASPSVTAPADAPEPVVIPDTALRLDDHSPAVHVARQEHSSVTMPSDAAQDVADGRGSLFGGAVPPVPAPPSLAGYELPFAELRDSEVALNATMDVDATEERASHSAELAQPPVAPVALAPSSDTGAGLSGDAQKSEPASPVAVPTPPAPALPSVDFVSKEVAPEAPAMELVKDDSHAAILQARPRPAVDDDDDEANNQASDPEVSFVVAARRKAFWRKPVVRMVLWLGFIVSLLGLALQIAVQERDRIAALDVRTRPWLVKLCEPLRCELAPVRQIADVVIDSSSFNKARGDSYQLALTMKSTATIPLAMPAVELTLTDAQDQAVLRRVLLPTDMAAPAELPAKGEWGTSVSVLVTTGGARVAGYRLLAFYP
ncbi:DUF3426 domain-containing protein [Acidovorax delafieldii]|uniref:DUF3426 domain-containing protein n=1 Tax=Acidovorax delafieldii TaxID=47920 RepID=UPI00375804AF